MIKNIVVTNYLGESIKIDLSDPNPDHGLIIKSIEGLGPAKANVNTTNLASYDGSLYNSARLGERNILIKFLFGFAKTIEDTRQLTYKYFPIKKQLTFQIETDNRIAYATGYVESNEPDIFSKEESNTISIICPDPYFYSAGGGGINQTVFYGIEPIFEFEFENDSLDEPKIEFSSIETKSESNVYYDGDAEVGVVITIHALGPASGITIYNTGTREVMQIDTEKIKEITGNGILESDDIIITTIRGEKSIRLLRNGHYYNILNALDKYSDWFQLVKGDNIFAYTADTGAENLQFKVENRVVYEGV